MSCFTGDDDEREGRAREEDERAAAGHEDPQALRLGTELPPRGRDHQEHRTSYTQQSYHMYFSTFSCLKDQGIYQLQFPAEGSL